MADVSRNPFTPGFGQVPLYMAGREHIVRDIVTALDGQPGDPYLTSIFIGARGTGKTALMALIANEAAGKGWIDARVSSIPGMLEDILLQARRRAGHLLSVPQGHLTSIGIGGVASLGWDSADTPATNWRLQIDELLDELEEHGAGLLITVDEVRSDFDEMIQLASVYQHLVSEGRRVALLMAGLPFHMSRVINDKSISFLRRATRFDLGRIEDADIRDAFERTVIEAGRSIDDESLTVATQAIEGFPFMMQLVGYHVWAQSPTSPVISTEAAAAGIERAQREMVTRILEPTYLELSSGDLNFLGAMLEDDDTSSVSDIAQRMNVSSGYVAQYRRRLMEQGVIEQRARGIVGFALPGMRPFLEDKLA